MDTGFFIGRDRELETLQAELSESDQFKDPSRIFFLRGQHGIGKRSLISQLFKQLRNSPLQIAWVRPESWPQVENEYDWPDLFTAAMDANQESLRQRVGHFKQAWVEAPKAVTAGRGESAPSRMQLWMDTFARTVLGSKSMSGSGNLRHFRLIFVLDNYSKLSTERKQWFSSHLFSRLITNIPDLDIRFILSGEQSFYQTLDLESYWVPFQTEVREIEVPPLSPEETREFARRSKVLVSDQVDLHELTSGVPEKIKEVLQSGRARSSELHRVNEVEDLFRSLDEESRNWILGAVHLRVFDDESLNIFGTHAGARKAFRWLRSQPYIKVEQTRNGDYQIESSWADAILRWQEQFNPEQYRKLASRVQTFREICEHIPEREQREKLARLSVFNFFNEELVHKVYGEDAGALNTFVRMYLHYFIKTPFNYQISMQYMPFVHQYVRLIPLEDKELFKEKVKYIWDKRREAIHKEAGEIEQKLSKERKSFEENRVKLDPVMRQIHQRSRTLVRKARKDKRSKSKGFAAKTSVASETGKQPKFLCLFFNVIGLFLLYYGMLFKSPMDWNTLMLGILFVVLGIFWPAISEEAAGASLQRSRSSSSNDNPLEGDTLINMLNLKRVGLENRASYLSMQVARLQRRLRELDTLLNEPYTF